MKRILLVAIVVFLTSCYSPGYVPVWKENATRYIETYKMQFLKGIEDESGPHFVKAINEASSGNDFYLLSTLYLTKYALHTASLERFDTSDFARIHRLEPYAANMAYCHFLKGNFRAIDLQVLPSCYKGVVIAALSKDLKSAIRELNAIDDPLSRLIACGAWVQYMPYDDSILQTAIATSSAQGWRRPLFAYLDKLYIYYKELNNLDKAEVVKLRLNILRK
jgi:hypothetical protein